MSDSGNVLDRPLAKPKKLCPLFVAGLMASGMHPESALEAPSGLCRREWCEMWMVSGGGDILGAHGTPLGEYAPLVGHCGLAGKP